MSSLSLNLDHLNVCTWSISIHCTCIRTMVTKCQYDLLNTKGNIHHSCDRFITISKTGKGIEGFVKQRFVTSSSRLLGRHNTYVTRNSGTSHVCVTIVTYCSTVPENNFCFIYTPLFKVYCELILISLDALLDIVLCIGLLSFKV